MQHLKFSAIAMAMVFSFGGALAQTSGAAGSTGSGSTGTSATGGGTAPAAQPGTGTRNAPTKKDDKVASGDRKFIEKAAGSGMFEVQVSKLAVTRAQSPDVKQFATMLVEDHTKANDELTKIANANNVELPAAPPRAMRREIEKLGKKTGAEFDKDYIKNVGIDAHKKDIKEFEKASKDVKDPELKAFVDKTLPTLKTHLADAQKLQGGSADAQKMGASSGSNSGAGADTGLHNGASTRTGGGSGANKTGS